MTAGIVAASWARALSAFGDHVWQTTAVVMVAAVLAAIIGRRHPGLRHHVWLAASLKFLVPFSALVAAGRFVAASIAPLPALPAAPAQLEAWSRPFTAEVVATSLPTVATRHETTWVLVLAACGLWLAGVLSTLMVRARQWRTVRGVIRRARVLTTGREAGALAAVAVRAAVRQPVTLVESSEIAEPGLAGWWRPVLMWPANLSDQLTDAELTAVMTHEVCHVRRRDNLVGFVHGLVQALFWFHPAVWWLGGRLVDERERACDTEVVRLGARPEIYAESLLHICRFGLGRSLPLVAGVTSSHLNQRVEAIMTSSNRTPRSYARRVLLATAGAIVVAGPVAIGAMSKPEWALPSPYIELSRDMTLRRATSVPVMPAETSFRDVSAGMRGVATRPTSVTLTAPGVSPVQGATSKPDAPGVLRLERGMQRPTILKEVKPAYPQSAKDAGIQGVVHLEAVILTDGTVGEIRVTRSVDTFYGLDDEAVRAAKQWTFTPAMKDGQPVAVYVTLEMGFRLGDSGFVMVGDQPYRSGTPGLIEPHVKRSVNPNYTPEAMRARVQGDVTVEAVVDNQGRVILARVTKWLNRTEASVGLDGPDYGLRQQAILALRNWTFDPATLNGRPVDAVVDVTLTFRLH